MVLAIEVNGFQEIKYNYALKGMYKVDLIDKYDDNFDAGCTILEFEKQSTSKSVSFFRTMMVPAGQGGGVDRGID